MSRNPPAVLKNFFNTNAVFLETTAAAQRIFGLPETLQFINDICKDRTLLSSTYVWSEFRRTFLQDTIICHTVLMNSLERGEDLPTALKRLPNYEKIRYKPRRFRRAWDVIARIAETPFNSLEEAIQRLENDILYGLRVFFFSGLHEPLLDEAKCKMTDENPQVIASLSEGKHSIFELRSKCTKKERPNCGIVTFWKDRRDDLRAVSQMKIDKKSMPSTVSSELEVFRSTAQSIIANLDHKPTEVYGKRCYAIMADLIMCLECPTEVPILTSNEVHYQPLCKTLGRPDTISFR